MKKSTYTVAHGSLKNKQTDANEFNNSKERFYHAIKWNTIEAVLYHALYFIHQVSLYAWVSTYEYGKFGSLISFSFLCVPLLMGALDMALIPHMKQLTKNKWSFRKLIRSYLLPQCVLMLSTPLLLLITIKWQMIPALNYLSPIECFFVGTFIACEAARKLLRRILQLLFYNKQTAAIEVANICTYMVAFWTAVFFGVKPSLFLIITPFLLSSIPSLVYFIFLFQKHYQELPNTTNNNTLPSLFLTQLSAFANQINRSLFSSNLLIPLFVGWVGFTQAGIATLAKNITYTLTYFLHKICSPTAAFLSDTTTLGEEKQKDAFRLSVKLFFIVSMAGLFGLVLYNTANHSTLSLTAIFYMCFFFIVHLLEHLFTLYEKFFTAQNKNSFLFACNAITSLVAAILFSCLQDLNFFVLIILIFSVRVLLLIGLSLLIFSPKQVPFLSYWYKNRSKNCSSRGYSKP